MSARRHKVVVIDDSETMLEIMSVLLEGAGCDAIALTSLDRLTDVLLHEHPDLILADIEMPGARGTSVVAATRHHTGRSCRVLFHSGHDEDTLRDLVAAHGADGYLKKSTDLDATIRRVVQVLSAPVSHP